MTDVTDDTDKNDGNDKVVSLDGFKKNKNESKESGPTRPRNFPTATSGERKYLIDFVEGPSMELKGFLGLTGSFLAIGDDEGHINFAVAQGQWTFVTDITDTGKTLDDFISE